jgi:phosphohistidine phosphatase
MATRKLVLVRHGKAADGDVDVDRTLTDRGRSDSAAVGRWLTEQAIRPDRVVVSPAVRAQQTWSSMAAELGVTVDAVIDGHIYDNDVDRLLHLVHDTPDRVTTLVLIGHNPSFEQFAHDLDDGDGDERMRSELAAGYPTCAVAVFDADAPWRDLRRATLVGFAAPRG